MSHYYLCPNYLQLVGPSDLVRSNKSIFFIYLQKKHVVTTVVERPDSAEARRWVQAALRTSTSQLPSVAMNSDVREIAARQRARLRTLGAVNLMK